MGHTHPPQKGPFRLPAVVYALVGVLAIAAIVVSLSSKGAPPTDAGVTAPSSEESTTAPPTTASTIEDEAEAVAAVIRSQMESPGEHVAEVSVRTVLLRPIIHVVTDLDAEDAAGVEEFSARLAAVLTSPGDSQPSPTYYVRILSAGGDIVGALSSTDERWAVEGPPAPTDSQALYAWLDSVYGSGSRKPELWFRHVTAIREPSADPEGYVAVVTTLDPSVPADQADAQAILDAVNSSGATFAPGIRIAFADSSFEWVGMMDGLDPFAAHAQ